MLKDNTLNKIENYDSKIFNPDQLYQIQLGLDVNLDVSVYAKPEYNEDKMREMRYMLEENKSNILN